MAANENVVVQSSYPAKQAIAFPGMPGSMHTWDADSKFCETSGGIPFARVVSQGVAERGVVLGGSVQASIRGVSYRDITLVPRAGQTVDRYQQHDLCGILTDGDIWVDVEDDVAVGDEVEYNATTGQLGSDGGTVLPGAIWMTGASAGGLAMVRVSGTALGATGSLEDSVDPALNASLVGAAPVVTGLACVITRTGKYFTLDFTLTDVQIPVTDAAGSGSSGSLKIFDFVSGIIQALSTRQHYTAFTEGAALTGGAGDAAFVMALGSVAANAGDAALTGTEADLGSVTGTITLSGGTATADKVNGALSPVPATGVAAAVDLLLNWSGSAATIDANSTIGVTGQITLNGVFLT